MGVHSVGGGQSRWVGTQILFRALAWPSLSNIHDGIDRMYSQKSAWVCNLAVQHDIDSVESREMCAGKIEARHALAPRASGIENSRCVRSSLELLRPSVERVDCVA